MDNWLAIIVFAIFLLGFAVGYLKGFLKLGVTLLSTALTIAIVVFLAPLLGQFIMNSTPLANGVERRATEIFMPELTFEDVTQFDLTDTPLEGLSEDEWENVSGLELQRAGITREVLFDRLDELPHNAQVNMVTYSPLPAFMRNALLENLGDREAYDALGVRTFPEYLVTTITRIVVYIFSFLATFLLAIILVRALIVAVDILGELPVVGIFNRIGGIVLGGGLALLVVWLAFMIISLMYNNNVGMFLFEQIESSNMLTNLYENNIIMNRLLSL